MSIGVCAGFVSALRHSSCKSEGPCIHLLPAALPKMPRMLSPPRLDSVAAVKGQVKLMSWLKEMGMGTERMLILELTLSTSCRTASQCWARQMRRKDTHIELLRLAARQSTLLRQVLQRQQRRQSSTLGSLSAPHTP